MSIKKKSRLRDRETRNEWIRGMNMPTPMKAAFARFLEKKYPTQNPNASMRGRDPHFFKGRTAEEKRLNDYASGILEDYML